MNDDGFLPEPICGESHSKETYDNYIWESSSVMLKRLFVLLVFVTTPVYAVNFKREPMPDLVFDGLKQAIVAYYVGDADSEALRLNLEGLDEIRNKLHFPKMLDSHKFLG